MNFDYIIGMIIIGFVGNLIFLFIYQCNTEYYPRNLVREARHKKILIPVLITWSFIWMFFPLLNVWCKGVMG